MQSSSLESPYSQVLNLAAQDVFHDKDFEILPAPLLVRQELYRITKKSVVHVISEATIGYSDFNSLCSLETHRSACLFAFLVDSCTLHLLSHNPSIQTFGTTTDIPP